MPRDFHCGYAYPLTKKLLHKNLSLDESIQLILETGNRACPDPLWKKWEKLPFVTDVSHLERYMTRALIHPRRAPSKKIQVIWLGLLDVEEGFDIRGSSSWSKDPDDWEWWGNDDYFFSEDDPVPFKGGCLSSVMKAWTWDVMDLPRSKERLKCVASFFATLAYAGAVGQHFFKNAPKDIVLGERRDRWLAVGHPDAEYGIILGRRTKKGWEAFSK